MALKNKQFLYFIFVGFILSVFQLTFCTRRSSKGMLWVYWGNSLDGNVRSQGFYILTLFLRHQNIESKSDIP